MEINELTQKIIGCAFAVYNKMGFGFLESVYEKCLQLELAKQKLNAEFQKPIKVFYDSQNVGDFIADILIKNTVIVELKSVLKLNKMHEAQLVNYLVATGIETGLLINFGEQKVEVKRKYRKYSKTR
ncbi:GxxExxY protein [bacterium]|nr:GxxExxY protein [bacterium]MBU1065203.1 GxxExxY protein [bacterium]MBU1633153.1 GxxExxY protein [bacterium]